MLTLFGVAALRLHDADVRARAPRPRFVLAFAMGCALSSLYGFLSGAWPFGVVEAIWAGVALRRFEQVMSGGAPPLSADSPTDHTPARS